MVSNLFRSPPLWGLLKGSEVITVRVECLIGAVHLTTDGLNDGCCLRVGVHVILIDEGPVDAVKRGELVSNHDVRHISFLSALLV